MLQLLFIRLLLLLPLQAQPAMDYDGLNAMAAKEYLVPIRPASQGRNPAWNEFSRKFTYAPAFDVAAVKKVSQYKFVVSSDCGEWSFVADSPSADLSPIWDNIPPSNVSLRIYALTKKGEQQILERSFLRDFPFVGPYNNAVRPYREAAMMAAIYIHRMKGVQQFKDSIVPDLELYDHLTYANKMVGAVISVESKIAANVPSLREEALLIARNAARFLMSISRPEGSPLAYFPPTYWGEKVASKKPWNVGKTMTMDACLAANAFLDLFDVTADSTYFRQALKIADTYARIQREDGSFPIKVDFESGEPVNEVGAMLHPILNFERRLERSYNVVNYAAMAARADEWMRRVALETFDLTGQFEDVTVEGLKPYQNLTNCTAAPYASYILRGNPDQKGIEDARDLIRLSEDQFVHWNELPDKWGIRILATPCVFEQHKYQMPVDNSSCNVANAYLDLWECTGDPLAFAKAKALIDNLTIVQDVTDGHIPTTFKMSSPEKNKKRTFWANCSNASIKTLLRFANIIEQ